jgi:hypothetical protein
LDEDNWGDPVKLIVVFCMGGCKDRTWACEAMSLDC